MGLERERDVGEEQGNHKKNLVLIKQLKTESSRERKKTTRDLP